MQRFYSQTYASVKTTKPEGKRGSGKSVMDNKFLQIVEPIKIVNPSQT